MSIGDGVAIGTVSLSIAIAFCTFIKAKYNNHNSHNRNNGIILRSQCLEHSGLVKSVDNIEKGMKRHEDLLQEIYNLLRNDNEKPLAPAT